MKQIYIVLTNTGTILSKIIRIYTKDEFAHVSISLDKALNKMYSFGRLNPYNPFIGGFIQEFVDKGTFKRFINTKSKIYVLDIEESKYETLRKIILQFEKDKKKYKFNIIGLFGVGFNIKFRRKNYFYCAEFVKYVMEQSKIDTKLPELIKPESFKDLLNTEEIYSGLLRDYNE